ncbi:uncharacterized protein LOC116181908 isoform X2 [Photinus pyralis]|uniref:uncharacterized protein LOC116160588 isoform X2 n=1 Tax=Photinus pyralis TaxID=7054 RepID=UPI0012673542|nr:uncharacterized protein LOC116160588 isoform X2 [Photinus pyralis]XP_031358222.1 uncharacterized protein LOC116181908 isoform X2 [Photinus pyralis]
MERNITSNSVGSILRAINTVAYNPTPEEQTSSSLQNLLAVTRQSFRPNRSLETPKRGRKSSNTYKRRIFLMKLAHCDFLPAIHEQKFLNKRGLGQAGPISIKRSWPSSRIKDEIVQAFPNSIRDLLRMSDFTLAKCDRQKMLIHLELPERFNGLDLELQLGNGMLILIPNHDFPNNLPILEKENQSPVSFNDSEYDSDFELPSSKRPSRERRSLMPDTAVSNLELSPSIRPSRERQFLMSATTVSDISNFSGGITLPEASILPVAGSSSSSTSLLQDVLETTHTEEWTYDIFTQSEVVFPTLQEDADTQLVDVKRQDVIDVMFSIYQNEGIGCKKLSVQFVDEKGVDGGGLTVELFTIFWNEIFASHTYFKGNDVLVPYIPLHKLRKLKGDFKILGRILGHMMLLTGTFPNKLAIYTFTGLSLKTEDYSQHKNILLQDFLLLLTIAERKLVKKALHSFTELSEAEIGRLTSLFSTNNMLDIPRECDIEEQIITIAEKVIIKDTAELYAEMRVGLQPRILEFLNNVPLDDIIQIWSSKQPTAEKVMNVLKLTVEHPNNIEEQTFFYFQNYVGSLPMHRLSKFLLFATASIHMPEDISVSFHNYIGVARRPIVHTCSRSIELGLGYESQQNFDSEMNLYLDDVTSYEYDQM